MFAKIIMLVSQKAILHLITLRRHNYSCLFLTLHLALGSVYQCNYVKSLFMYSPSFTYTYIFADSFTTRGQKCPLQNARMF